MTLKPTGSNTANVAVLITLGGFTTDCEECGLPSRKVRLVDGRYLCDGCP